MVLEQCCRRYIDEVRNLTEKQIGGYNESNIQGEHKMNAGIISEVQ